MKAAIFHEAHQPLTIENVEHAPLKRREVLVRTAYAGLCHSDLHFMEALPPFILLGVAGIMQMKNKRVRFIPYIIGAIILLDRKSVV